MIASLWLQYIHANKAIAAAGMLAGVMFAAVVIAGIFDFIHTSDEVCREVIYAAILLYLMVAVACGWACTFQERHLTAKKPRHSLKISPLASQAS